MASRFTSRSPQGPHVTRNVGSGRWPDEEHVSSARVPMIGHAARGKQARVLSFKVCAAAPLSSPTQVPGGQASNGRLEVPEPSGLPARARLLHPCRYARAWWRMAWMEWMGSVDAGPWRLRWMGGEREKEKRPGCWPLALCHLSAWMLADDGLQWSCSRMKSLSRFFLFSRLLVRSFDSLS